jgi:hypothetical protein
MGGVLPGGAATIFVAGTGLVTAATLRVRGLPKLLLAAYVVAFAEIVGLTFFLSAIGALSRPGFIIGSAGLLATAVAIWLVLNRPPFPIRRVEEIRALGKTPALLALCVTVGCALAYVVALIVGTPPNTWDSLVYHLARAALWNQAGHVGYISNAYDPRLAVTRNEHFAGFVQFTAALACTVGVFILARRLRIERREAAFGALLFLTLPIVLLQASTTQNDVVAASFLVAAAAFLTSASRWELGLASLATALAVGTKAPALYGLPVLFLIALVAPPPTRRAARFAALVIGAVIGSYWYAFNVFESGRFFGGIPQTSVTVSTGLFRPLKEIVLHALVLVVDSFDLSGAQGADIFLYAVVAMGVAAAWAIGSSRAGKLDARSALLAGALVLLPMALYPGSYALWRVFAKLRVTLAAPVGLFPVEGWPTPTRADETFSWFGPVGLFLVVGVGATAVVLVKRRRLPPLAAVYAAAPLLWLLLLSVSLAYDPLQGRLFVFPVALSAPLWGLVLRVRSIAWAAVAVAATTATLSLVHYEQKPAGLRLIDGNTPVSVWSMKRWEVQSAQRLDLRSSLQFVNEHVPRHAVIALELENNDFGYAVFGPALERKVELLTQGSSGDDAHGAGWLVASSSRASKIDRACWRLMFLVPKGWGVFRRRSTTCA